VGVGDKARVPYIEGGPPFIFGGQGLMQASVTGALIIKARFQNETRADGCRWMGPLPTATAHGLVIPKGGQIRVPAKGESRLELSYRQCLHQPHSLRLAPAYDNAVTLQQYGQR
jgi:hypothetical protein